MAWNENTATQPNMYVWNTATLAWERMTQPLISAGTVVISSGTLTANQGTPTTTANRWPVQITDGTNLATVTAGGLVNVSVAAAVDVSDRAARLVGVVNQGTPASQANAWWMNLVDSGARVLGVVNQGFNGPVALGALNASVVQGSQGGSMGFTLNAGTLTGTLVPEFSFDNGSTYPVTGYFIDPVTAVHTTSLAVTNPNPASNLVIAVPGGASHCRVRVSVYTVGTANGNLFTANALSHVLDTGAVSTAAPTYATATRQPLSLTTGGAVRVDASASTQPVSIAAAVTANQGTPAVVANKWPVSITDGTNTGAVKAASTVPVAADPTQVVSISPNLPAWVGTGGMPHALVQGTTLLNVVQTSAAGGGQTVTLTGAAGTRVHVRRIVLYASGAGNPTLTVADGATTVLDYGTPAAGPTATFIDSGQPILSGTTGNNVVVTVGLILAQTTILSVIADRF